MAELQRTGISGSLVLSGSVDGPSGFPSGHGAFYVSGGFPYFSSSATSEVNLSSSGGSGGGISFNGSTADGILTYGGDSSTADVEPLLTFTSPNLKIDTGGHSSITLEGGASSEPYINLKQDSSERAMIRYFSSASASDTHLQLKSAQDLWLNPYATGKGVLISNGPRSASPSALLHITGSDNTSLFKVSSDSSANILTVSGSGRVGINCDDPGLAKADLTLGGYSSTLAVIGLDTADGADSKKLTILGGGVATYLGNAIPTAQRGAMIDLMGNEYSTGRGDLHLSAGNGNSGDRGVIIFNTGDADATSTEKMRLSGSNLGIGVNDPDQKLEVSGAIHISAEGLSISAPAAGDGGVLYTKADGKPYWISDDLSETDLTATGGGGGGGIAMDGSTANGILTYSSALTASVESNLIFDGADLFVSGAASYGNTLAINTPTEAVALTLRSPSQDIAKFYRTTGKALIFRQTGDSHWLYPDDNNLIIAPSAIEVAKFHIGGRTRFSSSAGRLEVTGSDNSTLFGVHSATNANILTVTGSGRVGIGVTDPDTKLEVNGNVHIGGGTHPGSSTNLFVRGATTGALFSEFRNESGDDAARYYLSIAATTASLDFEAGGGSTTAARIMKHKTGANGYGGHLLFSTRTADDALAERMRITDSGSIGIGTSTPGDYWSSTNQLVVKGSGHAGITIAADPTSNSTLAFADGTSGTDIYAGLVQYSHGLNAFRINTSGSLAETRLYISETHVSSSVPVSASSIYLPAGDATSDPIGAIEAVGAGRLKFRSNGIEALWIDSNGNTSIRQNWAIRSDYELSIGSADESRLRWKTGRNRLELFKDVGGVPEVRMHMNQDGTFGYGDINHSASAIIHISGSDNTSLFKVSSDSTANILNVSGSGYIGIGTTPQSGYRLNVNGDVRVMNSRVLAEQFVWYSDSTKGYIKFDDGQLFNGLTRVSASANARLEVTGSDNSVLFGVHSTSTGSILTVSGSGTVSITGSLQLSNGVASAPSIHFDNQRSTGFYSPGPGQLAATVEGTHAQGGRVLHLEGTEDTAYGNNNVAIGPRTLTDLLDYADQPNRGGYNVALGGFALSNITTGNSNLAIGRGSLWYATGASSNNTAIGLNTILASGVKNGNTAIGYLAGSTLASGDNCVFIGKDTKGVPTLDNQIALGYQASASAANTAVIGNSSITSFAPGGDGTCDLGQPSYKWKDLYVGHVALVSGSQYISSDSSIDMSIASSRTITLKAGSGGVVVSGSALNMRNLTDDYSGTLSWITDGSSTRYFKFEDDVLIDDGEKLYFNDAGGEYISGDGNDLTISSGRTVAVAATSLQVQLSDFGTTGDRATFALDSNGHLLLENYAGGSAGQVAIRPGSGANSTTFFQVQSEGGRSALNVDTTNQRVGIGEHVTAPAYFLDVSGSAGSASPDENAYIARFFNDGGHANSAGIIIQCSEDDGAPSKQTIFLRANDGDGTITGHLAINTSGVFALTDSSDEKLKDNIRPTKYVGLDVIKGINIYDFEWKKSGKTRAGGFVAQNVEEFFPEAVSDTVEDGGEITKGVSYGVLIAPAIKAIQEQQEIIEKLLARVEELEKKIN